MDANSLRPSRPLSRVRVTALNCLGVGAGGRPQSSHASGGPYETAAMSSPAGIAGELLSSIREALS